MSMKLEFAGEGRLSLSLDSRLWAMFIRRADCKIHAGSRYVFTVAHDLMHLLMTELWHWFNDKPPISDLLVWFDPYAADMSRSGDRMRAIVFSEVLHVRFLRLAERVKASADVFRMASPRHQDRGSGDAVTDNDNLEKRKESPISLRLRQIAQRLYIELSLITRRSSNAGRRNLGPLRRFNDPLLQ